MTELGQVSTMLCRIRDKERGNWFAPLLGFLGLKERQRPCPDVRESCVDLAGKVSCGDACETHQHAAGPLGISLVRSSIRGFVQEAGPGMAMINKEYADGQIKRLEGS